MFYFETLRGIDGGHQRAFFVT